MKTKANVEELEKKIDFESVSNRLLELSESGGLRRKKSIANLLDRVKPALLQARKKKVSFGALTHFLIESGIPISEPTLRAYLRTEEPRKKKKQPARKALLNKNRDPGVAESEAGTKAGEPVDAESTRKLPPRLARKAN